MSGATSEADAQTRWVERVLGVPPGGPAQAATQALPPFQVFVRSSDGMTLTLTLPDREQTPIGALLGLVEDRTGIGWDEQYLTTGTKPVDRQHASLPVAEYGIQPNQTLSLQGRLKGGFGERAAIAETVLKGITHGNALGDIHKTEGFSKALKDFSRALLEPTKKKKDGEEVLNPIAITHLQTIKEKAIQLELTTEEDSLDWFQDNISFISAIATTELKAGNCGDYTDVVYSHLMAQTTNQTVYQVIMKRPFDHQFVVTSPTDHGNDIAALASDPAAMVADAWWKNTICSFRKFVAGNNPYGKPVELTKLEIDKKGLANGKPFPEEMARSVAESVNSLKDEYQHKIEKWAAANHQKTTALVDAITRIEALNTTVDKVAGRLAQLDQSLGDLDVAADDLATQCERLGVSMQRTRNEISECETTVYMLQQILMNLGREEQTDEVVRQIRTESQRFNAAYAALTQAEARLEQDQAKLADIVRQYQEVERKRDKGTTERDLLQDAKQDYDAATAKVRRAFGDVRHPWDDGMRDQRTAGEVYQGVLLALTKGDRYDFTNEVAGLADEDFRLFWNSDREFKGFRKMIEMTAVPDLLQRARDLNLG